MPDSRPRNTVVALGELHKWGGVDYPPYDITYPVNNDIDIPMTVAEGLMTGDDPEAPGTPALVIVLPDTEPQTIQAIIREVQRLRFEGSDGRHSA